MLAAADMGELEVIGILEHRGSAKKRLEMEFLVDWSDGEKTWETWETVKKLAAVERYIEDHPEARLKALLPAKKK
jgi:hypothetical protein